jgi:hypothetical protein
LRKARRVTAFGFYYIRRFHPSVLWRP